MPMKTSTCRYCGGRIRFAHWVRHWVTDQVMHSKSGRAMVIHLDGQCHRQLELPL